MLLTSRNELRRHAYTDYEAGTYFPRFVTVSDDGRQYQNEQLPEMTFASVANVRRLSFVRRRNGRVLKGEEDGRSQLP